MKSNTAKATNKGITYGSGNVFADLGRPNAVQMQTKVRLAVALQAIIKKRKLTQAQLAEELGVNQPKVSALVNGKLNGFSVDRLIQFLLKLGHDVEMVVKKTPATRESRFEIKAA